MPRNPFAPWSVCALLLAWAAPAQQPPLVNQLPADSPTVYRQFFYFHLSFNEWLATRTAGKTPAVAADLNRKAAAAFGLTESDHQQVTTITTAIARELRAIDQEEIAHANSRARYEQHPLPAVLRQLETRRQDAVNRGTAQLQQSLPQAAWSSLRGYINGPYRGAIRVQ
jgi:hypothetical protein